MEFFDSHAHYQDEKYNEDRAEIIQKIYEDDIKRAVIAGYSIKASIEAVKLAKQYDYLYATAGISPNDVEDKDNLEEIIKLLRNKKANKIVAVGEIGLDYYWNKENKEEQKELFLNQINLANEFQLPIVIHCRDAYIDTIDMLKNKIEARKKGVFHCCPLNLELIKDALKLGFYISFAGPITFKNSKNAEEAISLVPLDKLLIETDSPYLAPEGFRGKRNDSRKVKLIAEKIANIKKENLGKIAKITCENAINLFEIKD